MHGYMCVAMAVLEAKKRCMLANIDYEFEHTQAVLNDPHWMSDWEPFGRRFQELEKQRNRDEIEQLKSLHEFKSATHVSGRNWNEGEALEYCSKNYPGRNFGMIEDWLWLDGRNIGMGMILGYLPEPSDYKNHGRTIIRTSPIASTPEPGIVVTRNSIYALEGDGRRMTAPNSFLNYIHY